MPLSRNLDSEPRRDSALATPATVVPATPTLNVMSETTSLHVLWLKRDLRIEDHPALTAAASRNEPVLPLYVHEPSRLAREDAAQQHRNFVLECLAELRAQLAAQGGSLWEQVGEAVEVLESLWQQTRFTHLWALQETTHLQDFERDRAVAGWCRSRGVTFTEVPQSGVRRGSAYRKDGFDFREHLQTLWAREPAPLVVRWAPAPSTSVEHTKVPAGRGRDKPSRQRGGRTQALASLVEFFTTDKLLAYPGALSSPNSAVEGCSRLSAYLAHGVLSDGEVLRALQAARQRALAEAPPGSHAALDEACRFYVERLYWRASYLQRYELDMTCEQQAELEVFRGLREGEHIKEWFEAWTQGRTGYPYVDAGMRFLAEHGWVNMRMRGLLASFALNDLWLDWREVRRHLALEFLDYEPAIHNSQIAIHSGASRMSGPLVYDAVKQGRDHDPQGTFVRRWVPELACLPAPDILEPWASPLVRSGRGGVHLGRDYPAPLVPAGARDAAKERVMALREGREPPKSAWWRERAQRKMALRQSSLL